MFVSCPGCLFHDFSVLDRLGRERRFGAGRLGLGLPALRLRQRLGRFSLDSAVVHAENLAHAAGLGGLEFDSVVVVNHEPANPDLKNVMD